MWTECHVMDERLRFVARLLDRFPPRSISALALGVSSRVTIALPRSHPSRIDVPMPPGAGMRLGPCAIGARRDRSL